MNDNWYNASDIKVDAKVALNRTLESVEDNFSTVNWYTEEVYLKTGDKELLELMREVENSLKSASDQLYILVSYINAIDVDWGEDNDR